MEYTARWGSKGFLVSPSKIVPISDISTGVTLKTDSNTAEDGTTQQNVRGKEPQQIAFNVTYIAGCGVDPAAQIQEWNALIGETHQLYIGGKKFGPARMTLMSVSYSDFRLSPRGEILQVIAAITLREETESATTTTTAASTASTAYSGSYSGQSDAMNAAPPAPAKLMRVEAMIQ